MFLEEGLVTFPTECYGQWEDTEEGLTVVCLVVLSEDEVDLWDEFPLNLKYPKGELMGDDLSGSPLGVFMSKYMFEEAVIMADNQDLLTVDYVCILPLGIIDWTGFDVISKRYWYGTFNDLNEEGQTLHGTIKELYKDKSVRLLTLIKVQPGSKN